MREEVGVAVTVDCVYSAYLQTTSDRKSRTLISSSSVVHSSTA